MKKKLTALGLALVTLAALAGQPGVISFTWAPTVGQTNVGYYFYYGTGPVGSNVVAKVDTGTNLMYSVSGLAGGVYWAQTTAHDLTWTNAESVSTNAITFTVPNPPGALRIQ